MATRRKARNPSANGLANKRSRKTLDLALGGDDEHIDSDNEESIDGDTPSYKDEDDGSEEENLDVKKVRLARQYLKQLEDGSDSESSSDDNDEKDDDDGDDDAVGRRLKRERLKREGIFERPMAVKVEQIIGGLQDAVIAYHKRPALTMLPSETAYAAWVEAGKISLLKGHDLTPTCVSLQSSGEKAVSGSKDHSVILWDIERDCRLETILPHWKNSAKLNNSSQNKHAFRTAGQVLSVSCSDDGRYAAVGKRDSTVSIFDIRMKNGKGVNLVKTFHGHKSAVTCLAFRTQSNQLFSGSDDRCIRHYNLDEMMYMETLYGHQFGVTSIDCHRKERPMSVSTDRTARAWKLQEDTHLIFRGGGKTQAADCITVIKDDWFVTGHQDGTVSLWVQDKKKAVANVIEAHGKDANLGRSIVSIDSLKGSDLVASGSYDGYLRFWKADTGRDASDRGLNALTQIPIHGFINDISFSAKGRVCAVAVGQEHRIGRWKRVPNAKNRIAIIKLNHTDDGNDEVAEDKPSEKDNDDQSSDSKNSDDS